jgi:hypothetical protein
MTTFPGMTTVGPHQEDEAMDRDHRSTGLLLAAPQYFYKSHFFYWLSLFLAWPFLQEERKALIVSMSILTTGY